MKKNSKEGWYSNLVSKQELFFMRYVLRSDKKRWKYLTDNPLINHHYMQPDFPGGSDGKASAYNVGDPVQSPGRKISWRRKWNPLQYSCLENPMDGGAW